MDKKCENKYLLLRKKRYEKRIITVGVIITSIFIFLTGKFIYIKCIKEVDGKKLAVMAQSQYYYSEKIENLNYRVFDKNGKDLLEYYMNYYIVFDPLFYMKYNVDKENSTIKSMEKVLKQYNDKYELPNNVENLDYRKKIYYEVDEKTYDKLEKIDDIKKVKGSYIYKISNVKRDEAWNIVNMLTSINDTRTGKLKDKNSLEMYIDSKVKKNKISEIRITNDIYNNEYDNEFIIPSNNTNIKLTVDKNIQNKIKKILCKEEYNKYEEVSAILMEADTGKIMALTQTDDHNPNINLGTASNHGYFPGSILKVIVEEAGLELGLITEDKIYEVKDEKEENNDKKNINVKDALIRSSNDAFSQIGEEVGYENIYKYVEQQGMLHTVLNLYDEQNGNFEIDKNNITFDQVRMAAIGQKIRITPIEALAIPNTIINNGIYVKPCIIEGFVNNNEFIKTETTERRRVIKKTTADIIKEQMESVVNSPHGTGKYAKIDGIDIGGKTGTTEYYEIDKNDIRQKYSDGWFVGFFEYNNKRYSMVVLVRKINLDYEEGGNTAAPIFKEIIEELINLKYI